MCRNLLGDFVSFEHVLDGGNLEAELVGQPNQHQDLVRAIRVRVHEALALENLDQRLERQIASRRADVLAGFLPPLVLLPFLLIRFRACERVADYVLDAHARTWIARRAGVALASAGAAAGSLRIFAERELDARHRAFEE